MPPSRASHDRPRITGDPRCAPPLHNPKHSGANARRVACNPSDMRTKPPRTAANSWPTPLVVGTALAALAIASSARADGDWAVVEGGWVPPGTAGEWEEREAPPIENTLSRQPDLYDHLLWQIHCSDFSERERRIAEVIVGNLDPDGFLVASIEEIRSTGDEGEPWTEEEVLAVLARVRRLDPPGIACRHQGLHGLLPANRLDDLIHQQPLDRRRFTVRLSCYVRIYRASRGIETDFFQLRCHAIGGALHQRAVKRPGDLQRYRLEPRRLGGLGHPITRRQRSAHHDLPG